MTIFVDLTGRIGNQMFQYAFARKIQEKLGTEIVLNDSFLNEKSNFHNELNCFKLNKCVKTSNAKLPYWVYRHNPINRVLTKHCGNLQRKIKEKSNSLYWYGDTYEPYKISNDKDIYISGYYQSEKYFEGIQENLKKEFFPRSSISETASQFLELIKKSPNSVCITVRRGNYITNPKYKEKYYVANEDYFKKAIFEIKKRVSNPTIFIFSDDLEWARENAWQLDNGYVEPSGLELEEKMLIMSCCNHFIISNSTFSWWAQFLSSNSEKIVISPKNWYADGRKTDIYQPNWIKI